MSDVSALDDELWDDLFHGCAFAAFVELVREHHAWPTQEAARIRAYQHYEAALAAKHSAAPEEDARASASD